MVGQLIRSDSTLNDDRVLCVFTAVKNPGLLDKLHLHGVKSSAHLTVLISHTTLSIEHNGVTSDLPASDIGAVELRGEKDVVLHFAPAHQDRFGFASHLDAVEFVGAVQLIQHVDVLRQASSDSSSIFLQHVKNTHEYAEQLWSLVLWKESYTYFDFVETLEIVLKEMDQEAVDMESIQETLAALCSRFAKQVLPEKTVEVDSVMHVSISPLGVLVAKVKALQLHAQSQCKD
ncbi:Aste57867_722 [Aphanomyces stellatus]|uniref:Aste57867_722 protein n=1 Tax=Aphanomyces stellatus TaxID=120398 RepID=A0A485K3B3_9STRA|nr:hypothetical protein As57867_000721 [Aphanomyces stellatus]VFT77946.1 Aste57867_722 [Aphanomyces stellatus]